MPERIVEEGPRRRCCHLVAILRTDAIRGAISALRRGEDLFRDLCDNALDMIQSVGPDGGFLYVNRAWRETLGYSWPDVESLRWPDVGEQLHGHVDELRQRVRRMETLTRELLDYHRSGREAVAVEQVDVGELLDAVMETVGAPRFALVVDSELPSLRARRPALEQVLRDIIGNAVEHHDRGEGRIRVAARRVGEMWEFRISDDGPGVGESVRRGVEELQETDRPTPGVGIGLHLVARRVRAATGRWWIEDGDGRGATVCFTWPQGPPGD